MRVDMAFVAFFPIDRIHRTKHCHWENRARSLSTQNQASYYMCVLLVVYMLCVGVRVRVRVSMFEVARCSVFAVVEINAFLTNSTVANSAYTSGGKPSRKAKSVPGT